MLKPSMKLTTEDAAEIESPSADDIDATLVGDSFGSYAILERTPDDYIQIGNAWQPDGATKEFIAKTGSDPWILEYHVPDVDCNRRADGFVTLDDARRAFKLFCSGDVSWREWYTWSPWDYRCQNQ
jgi:hypothetical protein